MHIDQVWLDEQEAFLAGKFYRPGGINGIGLKDEMAYAAREDAMLLEQLINTLLVPKNPLVRRHLEQLAGFSYSAVVNKKKELPKELVPRVRAYHSILTSADPKKMPAPITCEEIYVGRVLDLLFLPSDAFELWLEGTLRDKLSSDPDYERGVVKRALERVERVLFPEREEGTGSPVSLEQEAEVFESKLMECYPDYYSVLVDMGHQNLDIPTSPHRLERHLLEAYGRATLRIELRLKSERFRSGKKEDVAYALEAIDKKYKDRVQPLFSEVKNNLLPDWLSPEMLLTLGGQLQKSRQGTPVSPDQRPMSEPLSVLDLKIEKPAGE